MKPRNQRSRSYNEHDMAVKDCASEFDSVIDDSDLIDYDAMAEVDDDDEYDECYL